MEKLRESLNIVVVGHVDHGKSTVIGRLLYDTKALSESAIERVKKICQDKGMPFEYAYALDAFEEEQKQGITIDTTQIRFHTQQRDYVIIDAPGHKEFLKNMVSGAANAEAAFLVIDAKEGIQEQSKRHGYILSLLGIKNVIVLVNKMDLAEYSEKVFNEIKHQMEMFLHTINVYPLTFIPLSAFLGENMTSPSEKMPWYIGHNLLYALDSFPKNKDPIDKPLRLSIQDVYKFDHRRVIAGRIESGMLRVGDTVFISPGNKKTKVKTIEYWKEKDKKNEVYAGQVTGITLEDEFFNKRGEIISHETNRPFIGNLIKANMFWLGRTKAEKGKKYKLKLLSQEIECEIAEITRVVDASTLSAQENALSIGTNDAAEIKIILKERICADLFHINPTMGRFVLIDEYDVAGGGIITAIEDIKLLKNSFIGTHKEIMAHCFDEYFVTLDGEIIREKRELGLVFIGDAVPVKGKTYQYPDNIDVIDLESAVLANIRNSKLDNVIDVEEYEYEGYPIITTKGFLLKISSQEEWKQFITANDRSSSLFRENSVHLSNKWFDFMHFRHLQFISLPSLSEIEYNI